MSPTKVYLWSKTPFLRLIFPFIAGIVLQWYLTPPILIVIVAGIIAFVASTFYQLLPVQKKYQYRVISGISFFFLLLVAGALLLWLNDIRNNKKWFGKDYIYSNLILVKIDEPLVEKPNSYKALASIGAVFTNNTLVPAKGKIIIYFRKDSTANDLVYGSKIIVSKPLQEIKNSGNPGSFNYKQYSLFQGVTHQAYLTGSDFVQLKERELNIFKGFVFQVRNSVVKILKHYIKGDKEAGLAEALLIGYKDDLDKNLVQSYSNTGVVHVIAISGLHLGIIYGLLLFLTKPLKRKKLNWSRIVIIVTGLWLFSLLAGAQPSVIRSAVMFTAIAIAPLFSRRTSIYNTLILSAFLLLCYNPFWLWDVGFQLSYAAVLSIIIFFQPVYNWLYFQNKIVDFIWKLLAVSIAAQFLTTPISLYHFHQFPLMFLFTNLVAVPLSSFILIGEILLCGLFFIEPLAEVIGSILQLCIRFMNNYVERLDNVSFAVWDSIYISFVQAALLTGIIAGISLWLLQKNKKGIFFSSVCLLAFITIRSFSFVEANKQKKIIVYNVPKYQAIDLIQGRQYLFIGDSVLLNNQFIRNFHVQPSRIIHRIKPNPEILPLKIFSFYKKKIMIIDTTVQFNSAIKPVVDVLVLSKNPTIYIKRLTEALQIKQIVIDGSVPAWKVKRWKNDCDSLRVPCYDVSELGAFVMKL
ncbi:MAG: ComEC/Rec2 family competence protein [Chitinophagaceae bacterium]